MICWYSALSLPSVICVAVSIWLRWIYFQKFQAALINCHHFDRKRMAVFCIHKTVFCIHKQSRWRLTSIDQLVVRFHSLLQSEVFVCLGWEQSLQALHFVCESGWMGVESSLKIRTKSAGDNYANVWVRMALCSLTWWALEAWFFFPPLENWYNSTEDTGVATDKHKCWLRWVRSLILFWDPKFIASTTVLKAALLNVVQGFGHFWSA